MLNIDKVSYHIDLYQAINRFPYYSYPYILTVKILFCNYFTANPYNRFERQSVKNIKKCGRLAGIYVNVSADRGGRTSFRGNYAYAPRCDACRDDKPTH